LRLKSCHELQYSPESLVGVLYRSGAFDKDGKFENASSAAALNEASTADLPEMRVLAA